MRAAEISMSALVTLLTEVAVSAVLKIERVKQRLGLPSFAVAKQGKAISAELLAASASPGKPVQTFANRPSKSQTSRQKKAAQAGKGQGREGVKPWGSKA